MVGLKKFGGVYPGGSNPSPTSGYFGFIVN